MNFLTPIYELPRALLAKLYSWTSENLGHSRTLVELPRPMLHFRLTEPEFLLGQAPQMVLICTEMWDTLGVS